LEAQILQRIILSLLFLFSLHANHFHGFISFAIIDTFTGSVKKVLLEKGEVTIDDQFIVSFLVKTSAFQAEKTSVLANIKPFINKNRVKFWKRKRSLQFSVIYGTLSDIQACLR
jgi:hypothetical protein